MILSSLQKHVSVSAVEKKSLYALARLESRDYRRYTAGLRSAIDSCVGLAWLESVPPAGYRCHQLLLALHDSKENLASHVSCLLFITCKACAPAEASDFSSVILYYAPQQQQVVCYSSCAVGIVSWQDRPAALSPPHFQSFVVVALANAYAWAPCSANVCPVCGNDNMIPVVCYYDTAVS